MKIFQKMRNEKLVLVLFFFLSTSCARIEEERSSSLQSNSGILQVSKDTFVLSDKAGQFSVERESGRLGQNNKFAVRQKIMSFERDQQILEQLISISQTGRLKNLFVLRPEKSQYTVWFDGQRYFSELTVDVENKSLVIEMQSPEDKWNGRKEVAFPTGTGVYCFYSQVIECAAFTGFINKAIQEKAGEMNFHLIWDGYPYIMEQYIGIPEQVFSPATLSYDGVTDDGEQRFLLRFYGETIFFMVNKNGKYDKQLWVSQGLSKIKKGRN